MHWIETAQLIIALCTFVTTLATMPFAVIRSCQAYKLMKEVRAHQKADRANAVKP